MYQADRSLHFFVLFRRCLDDAVPFFGFFYFPLPPVGAGYGSGYLDTSTEAAVQQVAPNLAGMLPGIRGCHDVHKVCHLGPPSSVIGSRIPDSASVLMILRSKA